MLWVELTWQFVKLSRLKGCRLSTPGIRWLWVELIWMKLRRRSPSVKRGWLLGWLQGCSLSIQPIRWLRVGLTWLKNRWRSLSVKPIRLKVCSLSTWLWV